MKKQEEPSAPAHPGARHTKDFVEAARRHGARPDAGNAFFYDPGGGPARAQDDLAEEVAEDFVESATSGEEAGEDIRDAEVPEETGGPFVPTDAATEFARGTDPSNPTGAEPAAFPTATRARSR
jgi:hypothetical protein